MLNTNRKLPEALCAAVMFLGIYLALAYVIYAVITQHFLGANDFYSRWMGAKAMWLQGENPYSELVTRRIQLGMYGRLARPDEDQVAFAYPIYSAFFAAPFVTLPYDLAQALWMSILIFAIPIASIAILQANHAQLAPPAFLICILGSLLFYPSVRAVFNGQFAIVSFLFLALALWAVSERRDWAAGMLLALSTVKPQVAVLLVPITVAWACRHKRWSILGGLTGSLALLVLLGLYVVPTWPIDFLVGLGSYTQYTRVGPPIQIFSEWLVRPPWSDVLAAVGGIALASWMLTETSRRLDMTWEQFQPVLGLGAIITTLISLRTGSSDQVLLIIPWLNWILQWEDQGLRTHWITGILFGVLAMWAIYLFTLTGDYENPGMTTILPTLSLGLYIWKNSRAKQDLIRVCP